MAATALGQFCALLRYTLLARLLGPEQLGLVATIILVSQFFESITDTGSDRFLVQDKEGDDPALQRLVQSVFVVRGLTMATGLLICAIPISTYYARPELAIGLAALALVPLIDGFQNLDLRRQQRHNDFRIEAYGLLAAETLGLIATATAAFLTRDFTAILYGLVTRSTVMMITSHVLAERRYAVGYAREPAQRLLKFGGPLLLNGGLLFLAGQSDRILIGHQLGLTELGHYSATLLLLLYPTAMLQRIMGAMHLPLIAAKQDVAAERDRAIDLFGSQALLMAVAMGAGFAIAAPIAVQFLYGSAFALPISTIAIIGVLQTARFIRIWTTTVAVAMGRSHIVLANNIVRAIGIPAALIAATWIGGLPGVIGGFVFGEFCAFATALLLINRAVGYNPLHNLDRFLCFTGSALAIVLGAWSIENGSTPGALVATLSAAAVCTRLIQRDRSTMVMAFLTLRRMPSQILRRLGR